MGNSESINAPILDPVVVKSDLVPVEWKTVLTHLQGWKTPAEISTKSGLEIEREFSSHLALKDREKFVRHLLECQPLQENDKEIIEGYLKKQRLYSDPIFIYIWTAFWNQVEGISTFLQSPRCDFPILLSTSLHLILQHSLPVPINKQEWQCVYSSERDGKSFATMNSKIPLCEECVIIIKDYESCVFGAYVPFPLMPKPNFQSHSNTILFSKHPDLALYTPTSINDNHVYFNFSSKSFPNGIGFGGQLEYFSFFVKQDLTNGYCRGDPSSTFNNPLFTSSSNGDFTIDQIEIWMIIPRDTHSNTYKKSIMDNPEAIALLEMAGKEVHSRNLNVS
jgi:hypothetical protein